jgi:adenosylhomocysteine nucleosidase
MSLPIGIVAATSWEVNPWLKVSDSRPQAILEGGVQAFSGSIGETQVFTVIGGIGMASAQRAAQALLAAHKPEALFSVGFAGSLAKGLKAGDFVIEGRAAGLDLAALGLGRSGIKIRVGRVASSKEVLETPQKKRIFHEQTGAAAVDMEWEGVKIACLRTGLLHAAVKIISDAADEQIPLPRGLRRHAGLLTGRRVFVEMMKDPLSLPETIRFGARSARLSRRLAEFLKEFITLTAPIIRRAAAGPPGRSQVRICR